MKSATTALIFFIAVFLAASEGTWAEAPVPENYFAKANAFYQRGEYNKALEAYQELLPENPGAPIYYNMGNCWFRLNQAGRAIVHYRKALRLDPRNREIQFNLRYAREKVRDEIENKKGTGALEILFFGQNEWTWRENVAVAAGLYALLMVMATLRFFRRFDHQGLYLAAVGVLFLLCASSSGWKLYQDRFVQEGAIVHAEAEVHSAADAGSVVLFKLHDGAEFEVLSQQGEWVQIELRDRKKGWVPRHFTEFI